MILWREARDAGERRPQRGGDRIGLAFGAMSGVGLVGRGRRRSHGRFSEGELSAQGFVLGDQTPDGGAKVPPG